MSTLGKVSTNLLIYEYISTINCLPINPSFKLPTYKKHVIPRSGAPNVRMNSITFVIMT